MTSRLNALSSSSRNPSLSNLQSGAYSSASAATSPLTTSNSNPFDDLSSDSRGSSPPSTSSSYPPPKHQANGGYMNGNAGMEKKERDGGYRLVIDQDAVDGSKGSASPALGGSSSAGGTAPGTPGLPSFIGNMHIGPGSTWDRVLNNPALPVACYCVASILMTVVNKFVVSGRQFTMNFLLLTIQSGVCVACVATCKSIRVISYRDFDTNDARRWFPISFLLVTVIYTGSKAIQFLSIPVYTIFKNMTIILIAYGEVIWFNGSVTRLTLLSFGLMVLSSLIAAWSDISTALFSISASGTETVGIDPVTGAKLLVPGTSYRELMEKNAGYAWMLVNCLASAGYVLAMRKRIKVTNFKDWDTMYYNNLLSIPVLIIFSFLFEDWSKASLERNFPVEGRSFLLTMMAFSGAAAVFISYTTAWCVRTTSSTTYSMVGALNKLPVAASGMLFFGDPVTLGSVAAVLMGFCAGLVYTMAKIAQSAAAKAGIANGVELKPR